MFSHYTPGSLYTETHRSFCSRYLTDKLKEIFLLYPHLYPRLSAYPNEPPPSNFVKSLWHQAAFQRTYKLTAAATAEWVRNVAEQNLKGLTRGLATSKLSVDNWCLNLLHEFKLHQH